MFGGRKESMESTYARNLIIHVLFHFCSSDVVEVPKMLLYTTLLISELCTMWAKAKYVSSQAKYVTKCKSSWKNAKLHAKHL